MKRLTAIVLSLLATISPVLADENGPLYYTRTQIVITHGTTTDTPQKPEATLPWQSAAAEPGVIFDVELRNATALYNQQGWFSLSAPSEKNGILLAFAAPTMAPIIASTQYAPLDVLFIDKEGTVMQILPSLQLSGLSEDIYPEHPVLAFLFLAGGTCEKNNINPGDKISHTLFKKPPTVLSAPPAAAKPQAVPASPESPRPPQAQPVPNPLLPEPKGNHP